MLDEPRIRSEWKELLVEDDAEDVSQERLQRN
jgi:hypothetical protein